MNKKLVIMTIDGASLESDQPQTAKERRDWEARRLCERACELERAGDYERARAALGKLWTRVGDRPAVDELSPETRAELLWRVGALSGWLGSANQIPGAQEFARDLLTESITLFESLDQPDKRAGAMTDLALCYWRSGAQDDGRALFRQALETAQRAETKLRTLTNASTVEITSGRYMEALTLLNEAAPFLSELSDDASHGRYHGQRGLAYKKLGGTENLDHALIEYSAASMHFGNAGHIRYLAGVENNIGFIHMLLGRATKALTHLDKARTIFLSLKDQRMVAQVNETRARVFLAEKRFAEAERAIFGVVTVLEQGDDSALLAEALTTQGSIFTGNGKYDSARAAFNRASEVTAAAGDLHLAAAAQLRMIEEMGSVLSRAELLASYRTADQYLGDRASHLEMERLRVCRRIVIEKLHGFEDGLIGGTLKEEVNHFEAWLIARALERANGSITRAARELGLSDQGLLGILNGRQSKTLARKPKKESL
jgi:tetratricopeptide (TPR) repeat protein